MSDLIKITKNIQRHYGLVVDGIAGPLTLGAAWADISRRDGISQDADEVTKPSEDWKAGLDARTITHIETLDPKVRESFAQFSRLAKATVATLGCDYIMISGNRTWGEQDDLYNSGRGVTKARGGYSNHNFGIAGDFGVFRGKAYLDKTDPDMAAKVHKMCSEHAAACGLEWGGSWKGFTDLPHYEFPTGLSMAQKRAKFSKGGSVV